jgi:uncharacterized protein YraI
VLGLLAKGDSFQILGCTYKKDTIGSTSGRWVQISFQGKIGWVFQAYVDLESGE